MTLDRDRACDRDRPPDRAPAEHPVHAPSTDNPWEVLWLPPLDYTCRMVDGVYQVTAEDGAVREYTYPVKEQFLADFAYLCTIIADGPL